jgi:photosystem II stability/assembly factor-like uncharacterized protein
MLCLGAYLAYATPAPVPLAAQEWEYVSVPPPADGLPDYWLEIMFLRSNPRYGWIVGYHGHTLRTTDSGRTWSRSKIPFRGSEFVTASQPNTWFSSNSQFEGVYFADSLVGYASGPPGIFKSTDGGQTWRDITDSTMMQGQTWGCYSIGRDTVFFQGVIFNGRELRQTYFRSTDGGATWQSFVGNTSNSLSDAIVFSPSTQGLGYATGDDGLWRTTDGGRTWGLLANTFPTTVVGPAQPERNNVWQEDFAIAGNSMLVPLSFSGTIRLDSTRLQITGLGGMRFSRDGGRTWRETQTRVNQNMFGTFLVDSLRGWAVGFNAAVMYTGDGGTTWLRRNCGIPDTANFDDLWFINENIGYIVGGQGSESAVYRYIPPRQQGRLASTPLRICPGDSVRITAPADWPYYIWTTGDTTRSITVRSAGKYSARTCAVGSDTVEVFVDSAREARIVATTMGRACEGDSVILGTANMQPTTTYRWTRNGQTLSTAPALVVKQSGVYTLTVENASGCRASTSTTVTIFPRPATTITAQRPLQFCLTDSTILTAPEGFARYQWRRVADGQVAGNIAQSRIISTNRSGVYSVALTDANGCVWQSNTLEVTAYNFAKQLFILSPLNGGEFRLDSAFVGDRVCTQMRLVNRDSIRSVSIPAVYMARNIEFSTPLAQFPFVVPPRSERVLNICFSPQAVAVRRDTILVADSCGSTPVALVAVGVADTLKGLSRCGPEVLVRSVGASRVAAFLVSQPAPNPASEVMYIATERAVESASSATFSDSKTYCALYTLLGEEVSRGTYTITGTIVGSQTDSTLEQGEFAVNLRGLPAGNYLLIVRDTQGMTAFPVRVER